HAVPVAGVIPPPVHQHQRRLRGVAPGPVGEPQSLRLEEVLLRLAHCSPVGRAPRQGMPACFGSKRSTERRAYEIGPALSPASGPFDGLRMRGGSGARVSGGNYPRLLRIASTSSPFDMSL